MTVDQLVPAPLFHDSFTRSRERFIPESSGCYVLSTFDRRILYVGLAENIRRRFGQHLDNPEKTGLTEEGRAVLFHWLPCSAINKVERTWLDSHILAEGKLPILNKANSPVAT